jgi:hypothetical protein
MTRYRNLANRGVLGQLPGAEFDADLSAVQEERLTAGGFIERVVGPVEQEHDEHELDANAGEPGELEQEKE